jgi:hypothetical protein
MISEALNKMEKIPTHCLKGLLRLRGFDQRKAGKGFVFQVAIHKILRKPIKKILMVPFEVNKKGMDGLCKNPDPAKTTHIGFDMHRVNALRAGVHIENLGQYVGSALKEGFVEMVFYHQIAHVPQRLRAQVLGLVGFIHNVQGVMPLKIEGQLRYCLFIGQIMDLLEQQHPKSGVKLLGGPSKGLTEEWGYFTYGKFA